MEPVLKADIFFFITSIAVVVFTIFFTIIGVHLVRIMKNFSRISESLKNGVDTAGEELKEITEQVLESTVFNFLFTKKRKKKK